MTPRTSVLTAIAAAGLAAVLVGGSATYASWNSSAHGETTTITAGDLRAQITQSGPTSVRTGTSSGIYPAANSQGIVPGVQAQRWTYLLTNSDESAANADATLRLRGGVQNASDYAAIRPYLRGTVAVNGREISVPSSAFGAAGLSYDVDLGVSLAPSEAVPATLTLSMPATVTGSNGRPIDVAVAVQNRRSTTTAPQAVFTLTTSVFLEQAATP